MTAQLWKLRGDVHARLTFRCPWCDVVGTTPVLATHSTRDGHYLFAACPEPLCSRGVMVRVSRGAGAGEWDDVDTGERGLLLSRRCVYPSG